MKINSTIKRAGKSLRQAKARTLLTSLAIAVGAFTIMMSLAAGEGTRGYSESLIQSNVDPQALFIVKDDALFNEGPQAEPGLSEYSEEGSGLQGGGGFSSDTEPLVQADIDAIAARDDIDEVNPLYQLESKYITIGDDDTRYTTELAVYNPNILSELAAGTLPERGSDIGENEIVVPNTFAQTLDIDESELIGQVVRVTISQPNQDVSEDELAELLLSGTSPTEIAEQFVGQEETLELTIIAVTKENSMSFQATNTAAVAQSTAKRIYDFTTEGTAQNGKYFVANAVVTEGTDPATVKTALEADGYGVQTVEDLQSFIFQIVNVLQVVVGGFGVLALIASVFGIINTMYISVLERTSQIGLMKALGMRGRHVSRLFRYEAAWIGFLGALIGIGGAYLAVQLLNPWINERLDLGEGNYLLEFAWWQAAILVVVLIIIAIVAGYFPARKAARLDPIEALRTE